MPFKYVEYLDRPVFEGVTDRQREKLRNAASKALKKNPRIKRAMLILRLNQRRITSAEAREQYLRVLKAINNS